MDSVKALANLSAIISYDLTKRRDFWSYEYTSSGGAVCLMSPDYRSVGCDRSVVAEYLHAKFSADSNLSDTDRAAQMTAHLLAALVASEKRVLLAFSSDSRAASVVAGDPILLSGFDSVVMLSKDRLRIIKPALGLDEAQLLQNVDAFVGFGVSPSEAHALFGEDVPPRGVLIFSRSALDETAAKLFTTLDLDVDLGDGPAAAACWGGAE